MVKIITDSAADFEPYELEKMDIACIPLVVSFGNKEYRENEDISKEMFYSLLDKNHEFPKTSQPAIYDIIKEFDKAADGEAVAILISSKLSGTYKNSLIAKNMSENSNVHIVDGMSAAAGQRILVEYAVRLRDEGKCAGEIVEAVEAVRHNVRIRACVNSIEYLYRGGRIGKARAALSAIANIKPLITMKNGGAIQSGKALGFRHGIRIILNKAAEDKINPDFPCYLMYTDDREAAADAAEMLKHYGIEINDEHIVQAGAVIGSHIGSSSVGIAYVKR